MRDLSLSALKIAAAILVILIGALHTPSTAHACTPTPEGLPPPTREEQINAAEFILQGTVIAIEHPDIYTEIASIEVTQYLKGSGPGLVRMGNWGDSSMCLRTVQEGTSGIFLARGSPTDMLYANYHGGGSPIWSIDDLAEVSGVVGQVAVTANPVTASGSPTPTSNPPAEVAESTESAAIEPTSPATQPPSTSRIPFWVIGALIVVGFIAGFMAHRLWKSRRA